MTAIMDLEGEMMIRFRESMMRNFKYIFGFAVIAVMFGGCGDDEFHKRHNQGINCLECHGFKGGGTIFTNLRAANYDEKSAADGFNIQLLLDSGEVIQFSKGNGLGNRKYSGDTSKIVKFTPQIVDKKSGKVVNQSIKNSHDASRLACNRCHTTGGINGAPGRVVNYDYYNTLSDTLENNGSK